MADWIDAVLVGSEKALQQMLHDMTEEQREQLLKALCAAVGTTEKELQVGVLRILIERARPLALSAAVWQRPLDATDSVRDAATAHLNTLGSEVTDERLRLMQLLYSGFATERKRVPVTERLLKTLGYYCQHCGLRFYNEELEHIPLVSPFGTRYKIKTDPLKPHWAKANWRRPTIDHIWPVSLYGDNTTANTIIFCQGCNDGKKNYLCMHQSRPFVGLPIRGELREGRLSTETFFAQLQRQPACQLTGRTAKEVELTVQLKRPSLPLVMDNLITVGSDEA